MGSKGGQVEQEFGSVGGWSNFQVPSHLGTYLKME